eukprot:4902688-Pyramimonas_sp.AAC.1
MSPRARSTRPPTPPPPRRGGGGARALRTVWCVDLHGNLDRSISSVVELSGHGVGPAPPGYAIAQTSGC